MNIETRIEMIETVLEDVQWEGSVEVYEFVFDSLRKVLKDLAVNSDLDWFTKLKKDIANSLYLPFNRFLSEEDFDEAEKLIFVFEKDLKKKLWW